MGKDTQKYNTKILFLNGLLAFGNIFSNVQAVERTHFTPIERTHFTPKQRRGRAAFKAQKIARKKQRRVK